MAGKSKSEDYTQISGYIKVNVAKALRLYSVLTDEEISTLIEQALENLLGSVDEPTVILLLRQGEGATIKDE